MKAEIKKRWIEALRSGQYRQAKNFLTDGKGFCCLGVLCNLHALETGTTWTRNSEGRIDYLNNPHMLPPTVRDWAGLESANPQAGAHTLAVWNDGDDSDGTASKRLLTIARLIEKHL